jgi:hypothetical protein
MEDNRFLGELTKLYGSDTARQTSAYLENIGLPTPNAIGQYYRTSDTGRMLFLDDYGCVVRFTIDKEQPLVDSPLVIQPLGSKIIGKFRADIIPGIRSCDSSEVAAALKKNTHKTGIDYFDCHDFNCGLLPNVNDAIPHDYAVILDLGAVKKLTGITASVKNLLNATLNKTGLSALFNKESAPSPQDILYAPLKSAFAAAWPDGTEKPDAALVKKFWSLCRDETAKGTLVPGWQGTCYKSYAQAYAAQNPAVRQLHL